MVDFKQQSISISETPKFLQNGPFCLYDPSLQNATARRAKNLSDFVWCFITLSWAYKKPQKDTLELLTKRRALQNAELQIYNFGFLAILLQNALVRGRVGITKCPIINHL